MAVGLSVHYRLEGETEAEEVVPVVLEDFVRQLSCVLLPQVVLRVVLDFFVGLRTECLGAVFSPASRHVVVPDVYGFGELLKVRTEIVKMPDEVHGVVLQATVV